MYHDKKGIINDVPTGKFLCPECIKTLEKKNKGRLTPEQYLKNAGITDKLICREFRKIFKLRGKGRKYENILKEAEEIARYKREGQMSDYKYLMPIYTIDEDGDLKLEGHYQADIIPRVNDVIECLLADENGRCYRRIFYKIIELLHIAIIDSNDDNSGNNIPKLKCVKQFSDSPTLHCKIEIDETITENI